MAYDDLTDQYNTPLTAEERDGFLAWLQELSRKQGRDLSADLYDYDLQGAYKAGEGPSEQAGADEGHFTDKFKKPNHPTFSDESQYHGVDGHQGGSWQDLGEGRWEFRPGASNLKTHGREGLADYFRRVEPPEVRLVLPDEAPAGLINMPAP